MKRVLITGKNSYIGTSVEKWLLREPEQYQISTVDVRGDDWKVYDFSKSDIVFHVAGIAHVSRNPKMEHQYYEVNRDLTIEVAKKAKESGVKQFIFMSSMIVYGSPENGIVTKQTSPKPLNFYGLSKLEAEKGLMRLETNEFRVSILRPPMIYGPGSKGNYQKLQKLAIFTPFFPDYPNKRSMLYINNFNIFIKKIIDNQEYGIFHPQNNEYLRTSEIVKEISSYNNKKILMVKLFNPLIKVLINIEIINKIFGDFYYEEIIIDKNYVDVKESIINTLTEGES